MMTINYANGFPTLEQAIRMAKAFERRPQPTPQHGNKQDKGKGKKGSGTTKLGMRPNRR